MSNILGIHSINFSDGTEQLLAAWSQAVMRWSGTQWILTNGYFTSGTTCEFASFLDYAFMVNGVNSNKSFNGAEWSSTTHVSDSPIANYIKALNVRLYLFNIKISGVAYRSRCWFSDLPRNNSIKWGIETGSDLVQSAGSAVVTSGGSTFKTNNIKVGDPILITSGLNAGEYTVQSIDSENQLTLTDSLLHADTGSSFWVGGNWFDVQTDDGDIGMGMGVASGELLLYKKNSVHRYNDQGQTLTKIKNMPGTTSPRSIVEGSDGYSYSYHPTGIYRTRGDQGEDISDPIVDVISGITTANQDNVVGWEVDKRKIKMYLGDVTLRDGEVITNCVAVFNHSTNQWSLESLNHVITCATNWLHSSVEEVYAGSENATVFQLNTGTSFNESAIPFSLTRHPIFPAGSEKLVDFTRLRLYIENGLDVQVQFKLLYKPMLGRELHWDNDQDWRSLKGSQRADMSEWTFPPGSRASGVKIRTIESGVDESFLHEKAVLYYANESDR